MQSKALCPMEVTFLPWLGLEKRVELASVEFVPAKQFLKDCGYPERLWLQEYFDRYTDYGPTGRKPCGRVVCVHGIGGLNSEEVDRRVRVIAAVSLIYDHALLRQPNVQSPPHRAESWTVYRQKLGRLGERYVTLSTPLVLHCVSLSAFEEIVPLCVPLPRGGPPLGDAVEAMARAALESADEDILAALDFVVEAFKSSPEHIARLGFIFSAAALELLSYAKGSRAKAASISEAVKRAIENSNTRRAYAKVDPLLAKVWAGGCDRCKSNQCLQHEERYEGFYAKRNQIIHEGPAKVDVHHRRPVDGEPSVVLAVDAALVMAGWLLVDRLRDRLDPEAEGSWLARLEAASVELGMGI